MTIAKIVEKLIPGVLLRSAGFAPDEAPFMARRARGHLLEECNPQAIEDLQEDSGGRAMPCRSVFDLILQIHATSPGGD